MTKFRTGILWPVWLIALVVLTAWTFAATSGFRSRTETTPTARQITPNVSTVKRSPYIRRSLLSPKLVWHLNALGDRLEKPGRERLSVIGTLRRPQDSHAREVEAVLEFPERLRLTIREEGQTRVITFDGERTNSVPNSLVAVERDLIETLVYGTAEHFFITQMQGRATRFLGSRFRLDDGATADDSGPYHEVYKVDDQFTIAGEQRKQLKLYYFNSETLLLERVRYEINRNGTAVEVEERLGGWTRQQGQQVARHIERFENGQSVFVLIVRTAGHGPHVDDGMFSK